MNELVMAQKFSVDHNDFSAVVEMFTRILLNNSERACFVEEVAS